MESMQNSAGELQSSYDIFLQSTTGHINQFKAAFQGLSGSLFESDFLIGFIDFGTQLLKIADSVVDLTNKVGGLKTVLLAVGTALLAINYQGIGVRIAFIVEKISLLKNALLGINFTTISTSFKKLVSSFTSLGTAMNALVHGRLDDVVDAAGNKTATGFLSAFAAAQPAVLAISASLVGLVGVISHFKQKAEQARQATIASGEAAAKESDNIIQLYSEYQNAIATNDDSVEAKEKLASASDALCKALGIEKQKIDDVTTSANAMNRELDNATSKALEENITEILAAYNEAGNSLADSTKKHQYRYDVYNIDENSKAEYESLIAALQEAGAEFTSTKFGALGGTISYIPELDGSAEAAARCYENLDKIRSVFSDFYDNKAKDLGIFQYISRDMSALNDQYKSYIDLWNEANQDYAYRAYIEYKNTVGLMPTDLESFKEMRDQIVGIATDTNKWFIGPIENAKEIVGNALDSLFKEMPMFSKYYENVETEAEAAARKLDTVKNAFARSASEGATVYIGKLTEEQKATYNSLYDWYNSLSDSDKELVYEISLSTDTAEYGLDEWMNALDDAQLHFDELMKPKDKTSNEAPTFNEQISTLNSEVEKLQKARAELIKNKEEYDSVALTLDFPELGGVSKDNLDDAIVKAIAKRADKIRQLVGEQMGNLSTDADRNKMNAFLQDLLIEINGSDEVAAEVESKLGSLYDTLGKIIDGSITQEEVLDFNKMFPEFKINKNSLKDSIGSINEAIDAQIDWLSSDYDARINENAKKFTAEGNSIAIALQKEKEAELEKIRAQGVDYANKVSDSLIETIGNINDIITKVQDGSITQQEVIEFNKLFPDVKIDMNDISGTIDRLRNADDQIIAYINSSYSVLIENTDDMDEKIEINKERKAKIQEACAAIADSYIELAQVYIDGIDKINSAISSIQQGEISAVDVIELQLIFPDINIDVRDAKSSVEALFAAREQANAEIEELYSEAAKKDSKNADIINAQKERAKTEANAKTADAIMDQIKSYADTSSTIYDMMQKVRDKSATQQDIVEFNQLLPNVKIDLNDTEGTMAALESALQDQQNAIWDTFNTAIEKGGFSDDIVQMLEYTRDNTIATIKAGAIDYANSISESLIENVGTINDMILKVQSGTVTQEEVIELNNILPTVKIDLSDAEGTIENLRAANQQILTEISNLYLDEFHKATSLEERANIIVARQKALQAYHAKIADSYVEFAQTYVDSIGTINDAISKIRDGSISASDIASLNVVFPDIDINVNDAAGSIQNLLDAREIAHQKIEEFYDAAIDEVKYDAKQVATFEAQRDKAYADLDATTIDSGIAQLGMYVDEATQVRDMMQKVIDKSATQQDIWAFNKLFPDVEIDTNDVEGSIANLNAAFDALIEAENEAYIKLLASTDDENYRQLITYNHEQNMANLRAAGADYARDMAQTVFDNADVLWDMIASLRDHTTTKQQILEFNDIFPEIQIDTTDTEGSIKNCKSAINSIIDDIDAYYENEIARAGGDKTLINAIKVDWAKDIKKAYAYMADQSDTYLNDLVDKQTSDMGTLSEALMKMTTGEFTANDQYELITAFPQLASGVDDLDAAVRRLIVDSSDSTMKQLWEQFDYAQTDEAREHILALIETFAQLRNETANKLVIDIEAETSGAELVANSLAESASETGLSYETTQKLVERYKEMKDFNLDEMFTNTAMGVRLNTKAMAKLESAYRKQKRQDVEDYLKDLRNQYTALTDDINQTSDEAKRAKLVSERDDLSDQIAQVTQLAASYTGLNSAYSQWMAAQETPHEGEAYENVASSLKEVEDLYNKGLTGTDDFNKWITMVSGQDADTMGYAEKMATYQKYMPMMKKWFTENYEGAYKFLEAANKVDAEMVKKNKDGTWDIDIDAEKLAKEMGVGVDVIEMMLYRLKDLDFDLDIWDTDSEWLHDIEQNTQTAIDKLHELGLSSDIKFDFETGSIEKADGQIEQFKKALVDLGIASGEGEDFEINLEVEGGEEAASILSELYAYRSYLDRPAILKVDTSGINSPDIASALSKLNQLYQLLATHEANVKVGKVDTATVQQIKDLAGELSELDGDTKASVGIDTAAMDTALDELANTDVNVTNVTIDPTVIEGFKTALTGIDPVELELESQTVDEHLEYIQNYKIDDKKFTVDLTDNASSGLQKIKDLISDIKDKTVTITTNHVLHVSTETEGDSEAHGTAHARGTIGAFVGAKKNETALTGELGPELVVRGDRFFTVGNDGAEFANIQKGDIIFDADQTKELLTKGKLSTGNTRGKSYASGTSYASRNKSIIGRDTDAVGTGPTKPNRPGGSSGSGNNGGGGGNGNNNKKKDKEKIDWIEVLLDRIERAIDHLARIADSTFKKLGTRLGATSDEIAKVTEEISYQQQGYDRYIQEAESVELSDKIKELVRNGKIDIKSYKKETAELIEEYKKWYIICSIA